MITGLKLDGWKSHLDSNFEFSQGVNALIGINGSGKSSVLDALSFAMFGTFPALKARRMGLEDLIMKKPQKKESCRVELSFTAGGRKYVVKRSISRGMPSKAELVRDGETLQVGPELVNAEVVRALQMDYDLFSKAVYCEQNGMDYFLRVQKGKRMDEIDRMLKVDRFEEVREGAVSISNKIKSACEEKLKVIADMEREGYASKMASIREEIALMEAERSRASSELSMVKSDRARLESELHSIEGIELEFNDTKVRMESVKSSLIVVSDSLERMVKRLEGRDAASIAAEKTAIENEIRDMRKWSSDSEKSLQLKRQEMAELNGRMRLETESADSMNRLGAKCPVCESEISDERKSSLHSRHRDEAAILRSKANAVAEDAGKISGEIELMRSRLETKERLLAKISSLGSDVAELASLAGKKHEYEKLREAIEKRMLILSEKYDKTKISELRVRLRKAAEDEARLSSEISMTSRRISDKAKMLDEILRRLETLERYRRDVGDSRSAMEGMSGFVKALRITQEQLRVEFLNSVNSIMGGVWKMLYPYGDFSDIRLSAEDDYSLQLKEPGGWVDVDSVSGGERSIAALALRIAFSRAFLPNLKWLILDEPTHNLDSNAIGQFSEILREKMSMFAEQVFLITHEERISEGVTGNMYRLERDKENDGVTSVVEI